MKDFNFQPFDKVLVRDNDEQPWRCDFFSHESSSVRHAITSWYSQMIPYNEDTKHLLGTSKPYISPEEAPKFEFGDVVGWVKDGIKFTGIFSENPLVSPWSEVLVKGDLSTTSVYKADLRLIRKGNFNG